TWTEPEIEQFEAHHAIGTQARLAQALLLYAGQRRSDVIVMGRQHVRDGVLQVRQQKTGTRLLIPIHPALAEVLAASPKGDLVCVWGRGRQPYTAAGFGTLSRQWCAAAGLPHCSSHGLRKVACRRLAEAGCTAHEIMSVSGQKSLQEVQRYCDMAD